MIEIPRHRFEIRTSRSSGPGGQNVNKVETKVEVRFRLAEADWLRPDVRERLVRQNPGRVTREGEFVLSSDVARSQLRNLEDCIAKLGALIEAALKPPKKRVKTKPTRGSKERRLGAKKVRGERKKMRSGRFEG